jgi:hypothetical protein
MWNFNRIELDPSGSDRTPKQQAALLLVRVAEKSLNQSVMTPLEKTEVRQLLQTAGDFLLAEGHK